jgi:predicted dithiol-disulfide oxidoreductase (DUF899 family)
METRDTAQHTVASPEQWDAARRALLVREKQLNRLRDELAAERRRLPWVRVDKPYRFDGPDGARSLPELFDGRSQLLVYHFMFGPDWTEGCPSCSFWADSFNGVVGHLAHRDVTMVAVSRAPYEKIAAYRKRMGWTFPWYSSAHSDFNVDFHVSFTQEQREAGAEYNYARVDSPPDEAPGISVFARAEPTDEHGDVFHTYSSYSRGLDPINSAYQLLDLVPKGRDEDGLAWPMEWVRRHDSYDR